MAREVSTSEYLRDAVEVLAHEVTAKQAALKAQEAAYEAQLAALQAELEGVQAAAQQEKAALDRELEQQQVCELHDTSTNTAR